MGTPSGLRMAVVVFGGAGLLAWAVARGEEPAGGPLGGPAIEAKPAKKTLVERDFAGALVRLDVPPAQAAAGLLDVDAGTRAKLDAIVAERAKMMDALVRDNLKLVVEGAGARQAGDREGAAKVFRALAEKARPIRDRGTVGEEFAAVLSPEQGRAMRALVMEYLRAVAEEPAGEGAMMEEPAAGGARDDARGGLGGRLAEAGAMRRAVQQETVRIAGREVARAYERVVGTQVRRLEEFLRAVNATPEQEGKIRQLTGDLFQKNHGKATPAQQAEVFRAVYAVLTPEQRAMALERVRAERGG